MDSVKKEKEGAFISLIGLIFHRYKGGGGGGAQLATYSHTYDSSLFHLQLYQVLIGKPWSQFGKGKCEISL